MSSMPTNAASKQPRQGCAPAPTGGGETSVAGPSGRAGGVETVREQKTWNVTRVALFLGAGASAPYGMPTTSELKERINADSNGFPSQDMIDDKEFPDIEHVLDMLDKIIKFAKSRAGKHYAERVDGSFSNYVTKATVSRKTIMNLIAASYKWDPSYDSAAEVILSGLLALAESPEGRIAVFTTNYDLVLEAYCGRSNRQIECVDGFVHDKALRRYVWNGAFEPADDGIRTKMLLHKLHGSMNWQKGVDGNKQRLVQKPDDSASVDLSRDMYIRPSLDVKDSATQTEPYSTILKKFEESITAYDACLVIGYSFRDEHVSKVLVGIPESCKILIAVSPTAATDFWENALGRDVPPGKKTEWEKEEICSMKFTSREGEGLFYALHRRLAKDTAGYIIDMVKSIIKDKPPAHHMASVINGDPRETEAIGSAG